LYLAERQFEIGEIDRGHARIEGREHEVEAFRLGCQACEPSALKKFSANGKGSHFIMSERDDPKLRAAEHAEAKLRNASFNRLARVRYLFVFRPVAFLAEKVHHRPGSRNRAAGTCARKCRRHHPPARPISAVKNHMRT